MSIQRYLVNHHSIETLLTWIQSGDIAIPEIQRPFVWNATKVRDFIDSLYSGYPVGYLITWRNPTVRLRDGTTSAGKRILIDGQQRIIALQAALQGDEVVNSNYEQVRIRIAFNPREEQFEVANPAILRSRAWIPDIAEIFAPDARMRQLVDRYCDVNPDVDQYLIDDRMERLRGIRNNSLGVIELNANLDVETVAEIFVRINSQGVALNAADFAMSRMAASEQYDGPRLRQCIDYFCHLAVDPSAYGGLVRDNDFAHTDYFQAMRWLRNWRDDLYVPSYTDMLRVAYTSQLGRGRLEHLVTLLSGRNFETRTFEEAIAEDSFRRLRDGIMAYINETNFTRFIMILRSAGFVDKSMIRSRSAVNFAHILYLTLRAQGADAVAIETLVRRWFVMSILTARYTGSPETAFDVDIRAIDGEGVLRCLSEIERAQLSDVFWDVGLPQQMETSVASSPYFNVFLASQVKANDMGFLSRDLTVRDLLQGQRHIHHLFPRSYLQRHGLPRGRYNQIANYVVMQSEINFAIGNAAPAMYFSAVHEQCNNGTTHYGGITHADQLRENLTAHCIPEGMETATVESYDAFLEQRRTLMAAKIRDYYRAL